MAKGKKIQNASRRFDRDRLHSAVEAIDLVKSLASAGFDETIESAVRLGIDPRKADQMVRGTVGLPSGTGKDVRVAVFASGDAATAAREAGADHVGADELAALVEGGMFDFDVAIATPDLMPLVGRLGRALGPRGLMPNPKTGTVTTDVARAVGEFKGGKVEYRSDRYGNVHVPIGKASFEAAALLANFRAVLDELQRVKPASAKGRYLRRITVSPRWAQVSTSIRTACVQPRTQHDPPRLRCRGPAHRPVASAATTASHRFRRRPPVRFRALKGPIPGPPDEADDFVPLHRVLARQRAPVMCFRHCERRSTWTTRGRKRSQWSRRSRLASAPHRPRCSPSTAASMSGDSRAPPDVARRRRRLQDLQEQARSLRGREPRSADRGSPDRSDCHRLRRRRSRARGQGAARFRPDQPRSGRQGRLARRQGAGRRCSALVGRRGATRGPARKVGRRPLLRRCSSSPACCRRFPATSRTG